MGKDHVRLGLVLWPQDGSRYQLLADAAAGQLGIDPASTRVARKCIDVTYRDCDFWTERVTNYTVDLRNGGDRYRASQEWSPKVAPDGGFVGTIKTEKLPLRGCLAAPLSVLFP